MSATSRVLLGVDVGNTNVKCLALSADEGVLHVVRLPTAPARRPAVDRGPDARLDADELWRIVCTAIRTVLAGLAASHPGEGVAGIAVASTGCEIVLLDGAGRQVPVCSSGAREGRVFRRHAEETGAERFFHTTGYPLEPGYAPFRLAAMHAAAPEHFGRVEAVLSVSGYVTYRLTGVPAFEPSLAGSLAVRDVARGEFWGELLAEVGVGPERFGRELRSGEQVGEVGDDAARASGLRAGVPVFAGAHDYLAAAFAVEAWSRDAVLDVLGTWEIIATFHDEPRTGVRADGMRAFVDTHVVPGRYSFMIEALVGGRIEWFRSILGPASAGLPDSDGSGAPLDVEHLRPRGGPRYLPGSLTGPGVGSLLGLEPAHSRADVLRSVLVGLVLLTRDAFRAQIDLADARTICAVGGGSANRAWMQLKADVSGLPVVVPAVSEATACGAALLAGVGAGVLDGFGAAAALLAASPVTRYEPDPARRDRLLDLVESLD